MSGPAPNRVCELARIDIPIIQAPVTYIAGAQLAAAVSNAGALGIVETMMPVIRTEAAEKLDRAASFEQGGAALQRVERLYFDGDMNASVANTGQVAGRIDDLPPATEIIKQMWAECREVLAATADRLGP
ncbi:nitronate monooxygenase [Mycobacterium sp. 663a-19]|uniref:nitronate monooxygenase n=1 Tax=Mycobacterium sp. 663a-19 TaxID=2986148 RepID=UPI002D1F8E09|nr:nitronate monooxygenase [Mycobacterium sp. 663a-19]MEB3981453.1 nitronate monooxygenase [Mycobacterium sp. 663a-19]